MKATIINGVKGCSILAVTASKVSSHLSVADSYAALCATASKDCSAYAEHVDGYGWHYGDTAAELLGVIREEAAATQAYIESFLTKLSVELQKKGVDLKGHSLIELSKAIAFE